MKPPTIRLVLLACAALALLADTASAQVTYRYTGQPFDQFSCGPNPTNVGTIFCPTPAPANTHTSYSANDRVTATLTFATALPPNLPQQSVVARPGFQLVLSDGRQTIAAGDARVIRAELSTDTAGQILRWSLTLVVGEGFAQRVIQTGTGFDEGTSACCDPDVPGDAAFIQGPPGTWSSDVTTCAIQMSKSFYVHGETVSVPVFRFANAVTVAVPVEIKVWLEVGTTTPITMVRSGADGSVALPPGSTLNFGGFTLFAASAQTSGSYVFACRLLNPITGKVLSESLQPFAVQ